MSELGPTARYEKAEAELERLKDLAKYWEQAFLRERVTRNELQREVRHLKWAETK